MDIPSLGGIDVPMSREVVTDDGVALSASAMPAYVLYAPEEQVVLDLTSFPSVSALRSELVSTFPDLEQTLDTLGYVPRARSLPATNGTPDEERAVEDLGPAQLAGILAGEIPAGAVVAVPNVRFVRARLMIGRGKDAGLEEADVQEISIPRADGTVQQVVDKLLDVYEEELEGIDRPPQLSYTDADGVTYPLTVSTLYADIWNKALEITVALAIDA